MRKFLWDNTISTSLIYLYCIHLGKFSINFMPILWIYFLTSNICTNVHAFLFLKRNLNWNWAGHPFKRWPLYRLRSQIAWIIVGITCKLFNYYNWIMKLAEKDGCWLLATKSRLPACWVSVVKWWNGEMWRQSNKTKKLQNYKKVFYNVALTNL